MRPWHPAPATFKAVHGWLTVGWGLLAIPAAVWWQNSVPFVVFCSVWANAVGHWSAWQASRAEDNNNA